MNLAALKDALLLSAERVVEIVSQMNLTNNCFVLMNNDHWCVQIIVC